jgi:hypothetical protein
LPAMHLGYRTEYFFGLSVSIIWLSIMGGRSGSRPDFLVAE